jgi:hypothetical protein
MTDRNVRIEDLGTDLFIDELGKVQGGQAAMTSLAGHEEPDWSDTPPWPGHKPSYPEFPVAVEEMIRKAFDDRRHLPPIEVTTMALGEE